VPGLFWPRIGGSLPGHSLTPVYLQQIFNRLYAIHASDQFLCHLLLVIGLDGAFQSDAAFFGIDLNISCRYVGAVTQHTVNLVQERIACRGCFHNGQDFV